MSKNNKTLWIIGIIALLVFMSSNKETQSCCGGCSGTVIGLESSSGHTTITNGHMHDFIVDIDGDGETSLNGGHQHLIFSFQVMPADGHTHELAR